RARLGQAIRRRPDAFLSKDRYSMDWYYPVLGGALSGAAAEERIGARWDEFVVEGAGVRCVADRPWVTAAETCELVLALDAVGWDEEARRLFRWVQRLRGEDGGYWTGVTFPEAELWPPERPAWTSGAVLLAADALCGTSLTSGLFRDQAAGDGALAEPTA
ncbi:MAG: prenyltransferase, partial [Candidatus Dormibacteraceae bacterium]